MRANAIEGRIMAITVGIITNHMILVPEVRLKFFDESTLTLIDPAPGQQNACETITAFTCIIEVTLVNQSLDVVVKNFVFGI